MNHLATPDFWKLYGQLPIEIQTLANKNFELLQQNLRHPSLKLKKINQYWVARIGLNYRAVAVQSGDSMVWFWIGSHAEYDELLKS